MRSFMVYCNSIYLKKIICFCDSHKSKYLPEHRLQPNNNYPKDQARMMVHSLIRF